MGSMDRRNRAQPRKKGRESMFESVDVKMSCQNDIKKLRRENEQLRREIWGLRDEYDKLEEILKQQKLKATSDNSDTNSDYSEEDGFNEEDEETEKDLTKEDNKNNQKLSNDEMHRLRVDFDELSVVDEEEELAKLKETQDGDQSNSRMQDSVAFFPIPYEPVTQYSGFTPAFTPECPFIFPSPNLSYSDNVSEMPLLIPPCPPMYANDPGVNRPISTGDSQIESIGFPSVSDLDNSSSEASARTRSTKVVSSPKLNLSNVDKAYSIPKGVPEDSQKSELESSRRPKHFFAPLVSKTKLFETSRTENKKDSKSFNVAHQDGRQPNFFSSENLYVDSETDKRNSMVKSLSCHDLPKPDNSSVESKSHHAKSENALDKSTFRTSVDITLKSPVKSSSPSSPEIPKIPSFDSKLFSNQYHQHFEHYRNYLAQAAKQPLKIQVPDPPNFCPGFYGFIPIPTVKGQTPDNMEQYQALLLNGKNKSPEDIQVTSFETPSPKTFQIPPLTPYDLNALYKKLPGLTTDVQEHKLYHKIPFLVKDGKVICSGSPSLKVQCEGCHKKVPVQKTTSSTPDEESNEVDAKKGKKQKPSQEVSDQKRKEKLRKQISVSSSDVPTTPVNIVSKRAASEEENQSSSSGIESPKKEFKKSSANLNTKRKSSVSSTRTSKSLSLDVKNSAGFDTVDSVATNSNNAKNGKDKKKSKRDSESVPWCACWGNGCI